MTEQTCRGCGCTDRCACVDPVHGPCWWVEDGLCSHCRMANQALANVISLARDLDCAGVPLELRYAEQLQRMTAWSMSQPTLAVMQQVHDGVDTLLQKLSPPPA